MKNIEALFVFGSHSRGDNTRNSDVDMFGITDSDIFGSHSVGRINLVTYPSSKIFEKCADGDIFILHIIRESKPLYDFHDYLKKMQSSFVFKDSYNEFIEDCLITARTIVYALLHDLTIPRGCRWLSWSLRSASIALSANDRAPVFATREIQKLYRLRGLGLIVDSREDVAANTKTLQVALTLIKQISKRAKIDTSSNRFDREPIDVFCKNINRYFTEQMLQGGQLGSNNAIIGDLIY